VTKITIKDKDETIEDTSIIEWFLLLAIGCAFVLGLLVIAGELGSSS